MILFQDLGVLQHILLCALVFLCFRAYISRKKKDLNLPPGPRGLPFVGILPYLGKNPHLELTKLGKEYGGIFSTYMGRTHVVVASDVAIAKELLSKSATTDRPPGLFQMVPEGFGFGDQNGKVWNEQRRYVMMELRNLGIGKSNWEKLVQIEVSEMLQLLKESQGKPFDVKDILAASISNNILSLITNDRLPMRDPIRDVLYKGMESIEMLYTQSGIIVHYPKLYKLAMKLGLLKCSDIIKDIMGFNKCCRQIIEASKNSKGENFVQKYLAEMEKNEKMKLGNSFQEMNLIGNVQLIIITGSETVYDSILWLLLAMASFPKIQEKVHQEVDSVLGKNGFADWAERQKFPYCMATIMEGQRWRTLAPLGVLRRTSEHIVINGYDIPKGTNLMTLIWALHNDPKYWKSPHLFQPERFLSDDGITIKEQDAYFAFSFGKRSCPGKTAAYIEMFHHFVGIMKKFQVLPESETKLPDLEGYLGLILQPSPQCLRYIPR